jgi:hypothetical protein
MVHHLWYDSFDAEANDTQLRHWRTTSTRQPAHRKGGARRVVGRALIGLGERIVAEPSNETAGK